MQQTIHFNTGRHYTANGQRITATLHDDGVVTFHDHSRMIDGEFTLHCAPFDRETVMAIYDSHAYKSGPRSWGDAFQRGKCNADFVPCEP